MAENFNEQELQALFNRHLPQRQMPPEFAEQLKQQVLAEVANTLQANQYAGAVEEARFGASSPTKAQSPQPYARRHSGRAGQAVNLWDWLADRLRIAPSFVMAGATLAALWALIWWGPALFDRFGLTGPVQTGSSPSVEMEPGELDALGATPTSVPTIAAVAEVLAGDAVTPTATLTALPTDTVVSATATEVDNVVNSAATATVDGVEETAIAEEPTLSDEALAFAATPTSVTTGNGRTTATSTTVSSTGPTATSGVTDRDTVFTTPTAVGTNTPTLLQTATKVAEKTTIAEVRATPTPRTLRPTPTEPDPTVTRATPTRTTLARVNTPTRTPTPNDGAGVIGGVSTVTRTPSRTPTSSSGLVLVATSTPTPTDDAPEKNDLHTLPTVATFVPSPTPVPTNTPTRAATATETPSSQITMLPWVTNTKTPTKTPTRMPTQTPTSTLTATPTVTKTKTATLTMVPPTVTATNTPLPTSTNTMVPPTATATNTPLPTSTNTMVPPTVTATNTPLPTSTNTMVPPTATATNTPLPTSTNTVVPTDTLLPTNTPAPTNTPVPTDTPVPTNSPPETTNYTGSVMEELRWEFDLSTLVRDADGDQVTIVAVSQPSHGFTTQQGNVVIYIPEINFNGEDSFNYTAHDGKVGTQGRINITVIGQNDPPQLDISDEIQSVTVGSEYSYSVEASDVDPNDTLTIALEPLSKPSWLSVEQFGNGLATIRGVPTEEDSGVYEIIVVVSDSFGAETRAQFILEVIGGTPMSNNGTDGNEQASPSASEDVQAAGTEPDLNNSGTISNTGEITTP